jgi:hypothetical protein
MSSFVGTGVAATVVLTVAVEIGPTKRSQYSSKVRPIEVEKAVGFGIAVPLSVVDAVGVGMTDDAAATLQFEQDEFWEVISPACNRTDKT